MRGRAPKFDAVVGRLRSASDVLKAKVVNEGRAETCASSVRPAWLEDVSLDTRPTTLHTGQVEKVESKDCRPLGSQCFLQPWWPALVNAAQHAYTEAIADGAFAPIQPHARQSHATDAYDSVLTAQRPHRLSVLAGLWVFAYFLGAFGLISWFTFLTILFLYCYSSYVHRHHAQQGFAMHIAAASEVLSISAEPERDSRTYESDWVNKVLKEFWPNALGPWLTKKLHSVLLSLINDALSTSEERKHGKGWSACLDSFSLGEASPEILCVREHIESHRLILDLDFFSECSGNIKLGLSRARKERLSMHLHEVRMRGVLRLTFAAFLPASPYFGQLDVSFVGRPDLHFKFSVAGIGAGIGAMLKRILTTSVLDTMVYPFTIPVYIYEEGQLIENELLVPSAPTGILDVKLIRGYRLLAKDLIGTSDPYAILHMGGNRQRRRSEMKKRTLNPCWNQGFSFKVWHRGLESLHVQVWDYDAVSSDDFLGSCEIELRMALGDTDTNSNTFRLCVPEDPQIDAGSIDLELTYLPLHENVHRTFRKFVDPISVDRTDTGKTQAAMSVPIRGLLTLKLDAAEGFAASPSISPYVVVRLVTNVNLGQECEPLRHEQLKHCMEENRWESTVKARTNAPVWKEEQWFEVKDSMHTVVHVEVLTHSRTATESLGEFQIPLRAFMVLDAESKHAEIKRFLPQCLDHRWHEETIVPKKWSLRRTNQTSSYSEQACVHASFSFATVDAHLPEPETIRRTQSEEGSPEDALHRLRAKLHLNRRSR